MQVAHGEGLDLASGAATRLQIAVRVDHRLINYFRAPIGEEDVHRVVMEHLGMVRGAPETDQTAGPDEHLLILERRYAAVVALIIAQVFEFVEREAVHLAQLLQGRGRTVADEGDNSSEIQAPGAFEGVAQRLGFAKFQVEFIGAEVDLRETRLLHTAQDRHTLIDGSRPEPVRDHAGLQTVVLAAREQLGMLILEQHRFAASEGHFLKAWNGGGFVDIGAGILERHFGLVVWRGENAAVFASHVALMAIHEGYLEWAGREVVQDG